MLYFNPRFAELLFNKIILKQTYDLTKAQVKGKHKSIITTQNSYIALKDNLTEKPSYTLDQDLDIVNAIAEVSHADLVKAISQMSSGSQYELMRIINKG